MNFFLLDDDKNVIYVLKRIIEDKDLGVVVGEETDGKSGIESIKATNPDIVLIDLLMPEVDGLNVVKELKTEGPDIEFIMISQVSSKQMIEKAYKAGVQYYISKPINVIEVESIIKKVIDRIKINRTLSQMQKIFNKTSTNEPVIRENSCEKHVNKILKELGIIGEKGSQDIISIIQHAINDNINLNDITIRELCSQLSDNPKSVEQRMRRAINLAMSNIASLGLEDYMNEIFSEYSNSLFNFEQVRLEMEYLRGNNKKGGSTNIKKFLVGIISYCETLND